MAQQLKNLLKQADGFEGAQHVLQSLAWQAYVKYGPAIWRNRAIAGLLADSPLNEIGDDLVQRGIFERTVAEDD